MCGGKGKDCGHCSDGYFAVTECPTKYIGQELIYDIQMCAASEYHLPVSGGLLDQSSWWFDLRQLLRREEHKIQEEQDKRRNR